MKRFRIFIEDCAANAVGGGQVAGLGVGPSGEPGVKKKNNSPILATLRRKPNAQKSTK